MFRVKQQGFTLIELLVVIAIIAILAAILFPIFLAAKAQAKLAKCSANMSQVGKAIVLYSGDWNDTLPIDTFLRTGELAYPNFWLQRDSWIVLVSRYTKSAKIWQCPAAVPFGTWGSGSYEGHIDTSIAGDAVPKAHSYYINGQVIGKKIGAQIPLATKTVFFTEWSFLSNWAGIRPDPSGNDWWKPYNVDWGINHGFGPSLGPDRKYNVVFCDGHVKLCNPRKLCQDDWVTPVQ